MWKVWGALALGEVPATAQTWTVGPDRKPGSSCHTLAGTGGDVRQQWLLHGSHFGSKLLGKRLLGFVFRREPTNPDTFHRVIAHMRIHLSSLEREPSKTSERFADNMAKDRKLVFDGKVTFQAAPSPKTSRKPLWDKLHTVEIRFQKPFTYVGKGLCIDILGKRIKKEGWTLWLIDSESQAGGGASRKVGDGCTSWSQNWWGDEGTALVGSTNSLSGSGKPLTSTLLIMGGQQTSVSLASIGARGCRLYVVPMLTIPLRYSPPIGKGLPGFVRYEQQIPHQPALMGAKFYAQLADDQTSLPRDKWSNRIGLVMSNAVEVTIGSIPITLGMSVVTSDALKPNQPVPAKGSVIVNRGPVMRVLYK